MSAITRETAFDRVGRIRDEFILEADISALLTTSRKAGKRSTPWGFARFMQSGWGTFAACAVVAVGVYVALLGLGYAQKRACEYRVLLYARYGHGHRIPCVLQMHASDVRPVVLLAADDRIPRVCLYPDPGIDPDRQRDPHRPCRGVYGPCHRLCRLRQGEVCARGRRQPVQKCGSRILRRSAELAV